MAYGIKGDLNVLRRIFSRFIRIESLSGNTGNVLAADNNGEIVSRNVDFFLSGSTIFNDKVDSSTFYNYTSNTNTLIETKLNINDFNIYSSTTNNIINNNYTQFTSFTQSFNSYSANTLNNINNNYNQFTSFTQSFNSYSSNTLNNINNKYDKSGGTITGRAFLLSGITINNNIIVSGITGTNIIDGDTWLSAIVSKGVSAVGSQFPTNAPFLRASMRNDTPIDYGFIQSYSSVANGTIPIGFQPLRIEGKYIMFAGGNETLDGGVSSYIDDKGSLGINLLSSWVGSTTLPQRLPAKLYISASTSTPAMILDTTGGSNTLYVDSNGVGILTPPTQKLDVNGNLRLRGNLFDSLNTTGETGYRLTTTPNGILWMSAETIPTNYDFIDFNTGYTATAQTGRVYFDTNENALSYFPSTPNMDVNLNIGQESLIRVYNNSGAQINNGSVTHISGSFNGLPTIVLANASDDNRSEIAGIATHNIPNNSIGFITFFGIVRDIDTSLFNDGDELYLSDTIDGGFTNNVLDINISSRVCSVGWVISTGVTDGKILVSITNENKIQSLTNKEVNILLGNTISTGLFEFTGLTITSSNTFKIPSVKGWFVDNTTNPTIPEVLQINYSGSTTGETTPYLTTNDTTFVLLTSAGTIQYQTTFPSPSERRLNIYLGKIVHPNRSSILTVNNTPDFDVSPMSSLRDLWSPIKMINQGIIVSPNGANLNINTTSGILWGNGIGWVTNQLNPNSISITAQSPATFAYRTQTGGTSGNVTTIDVGNYDSGGIVTPISGSQYSTQRIYLFATGLIRIQYGQTTYTTLSKALAGLTTEIFIENSNSRDNGILIGLLTVSSNATDLSNTSQAIFTQVSKFGEVLTGTAGGLSTTTLQQAYDNSSQPEILTNSTLGAVTFRRGSSSDSDSVIEVQTNSGANTFRVNGLGDVSGNSLNLKSYLYDSTGLSGLTNQVLFTSPSGVVWNNIDSIVTGYTSSKLDTVIYTSFTNSFYSYSANTNTLIGTKLNISDFDSYSANTNTLIGTKLYISDFDSYSANTNTLIGTKLNISDFNIYSSTTKNILDSKVIELGSGVGSTLRVYNNNISSGNYSGVLGGTGNTSIGDYSFIGGGEGNTASGYTSSVLGGGGNTALPYGSIIGGGWFNRIIGSSPYSTIGGGIYNRITNLSSFIGGGFSNTNSGQYSGIMVGTNNLVSSNKATINGGDSNTVSGQYSFIGGGLNNVIIGNYSTIGNGDLNTITGNTSGIGSGSNNKNNSDYSFIGGGTANTINSLHSFIGGGRCNRTSGLCSVIGGGCGNTMSGTYNVIAGGRGNTTSNVSSNVAGGNANIASGGYSAISGGRNNCATGTNSVIAGGAQNTVSANYTGIGGGCNNRVTSIYGYVGGGNFNTVSGGTASFIGNGSGNTINSFCSVIGGGANNISVMDLSFIGGGISNAICGNGFWGVIGGGVNNRVTNIYGAVMGGSTNTASAPYSGIGGGRGSLNSGYGSFIGGGCSNTVSNAYSVVGGGIINTITSVCSTIGGGRRNIITNVSSVIAGGYTNTSSGQYSTIGGGYVNAVTGNYSTVSGGYCNSAVGGCSFIGGGRTNRTTDTFSSVVGGRGNTSSGYASYVGGGLTNTTLGNSSSVNSGVSNTATGTCSIIGSGIRNITTGPLSGILAGSGNTVSGFLSGILAGSGNTVSGVSSGIFGGRNNLNACSNSFIIGSNITATANDTTFTQSLNTCGQTIIQGTSASSGCALLVRNSTPLSLYTVLNTGQHIFDSSFTATANCSNGWLNCQTINQRTTVGDLIVGTCLSPTIRATNNFQTNKALSVIPLFTASTLSITGGTNIIAEFGATNIGTQLTINDATTGVIYGVNDVSGLPIIDATSNWDVNIYDFPNTVFSKTGKTLTLGVIRNTASTVNIQSDVVFNEGIGLDYRMSQVSGVTIGSTTAVLFQLPINTGQTVFLTTNTLGRANNASMDSTLGELKFTAKRSLTGSLTQVGTIQGFVNADNINTNIGIDISSNNVRLVVTGNTDTYLWASTIIAQTY